MFTVYKQLKLHIMLASLRVSLSHSMFKVYGHTSQFFAIFTKGNMCNFCDLVVCFFEQFKERICSWSKSFPLRVYPIGNGNKNGRVASP